jgi:hypothetical protein
MRPLVAAAALVLAGIASPVAAQVSGTYSVEGKDTDGTAYRGSVTVTPIGENYRVVWRIGDTTYSGTGLSAGEAFAVSYSWRNNVGVGLYVREGDAWIGIWTGSDQREQGAEIWRRR